MCREYVLCGRGYVNVYGEGGCLGGDVWTESVGYVGILVSTRQA